MTESNIAGLDCKNIDDWKKITAAYGRERFPTGGLPAIPANAENEGTINPSKLSAGTVITVMTGSPAKYVLTVREDGFVSIERFTWNPMFGFRSFEEDIKEYETQKERYDKHQELAYQGFDVFLPYLPEKPWQFDSCPFSVKLIEAGQQMVVLQAWDHYESYIETTAVAFWTIDHS